MQWTERYPPIAAAADHPLLPWFLARVDRRTRWHHYITGRFPGQISPFFYVILFLVLNCFAIIFILAATLVRNLRSGRPLERPSDFFFTDDRHRLHDLWLTRISARDMLAMEIAIHLNDDVHQLHRVIILILTTIGAIIVPLGATSLDDPMYMLIWFAATLLACSLSALYVSEVMCIRGVITNFERTVKKRRAGPAGSIARTLLIVLGLCLAAPVGFYFVGIIFRFLFPSFQEIFPLRIAMVLFSIAGVVIYNHFWLLPRKTSAYFEKVAARCEEHFAEILRAESEKPGK